MKKSRVIFTSIIFIIFLMAALINNKIEATPVDPVLYFGIAEIRTTTNMGYAMGDPNQEAEKIWKIVKYSNTNYNDPTEVSAYCIKADTGFTNQNLTDVYDVSYNMKTERNEIAKQNTILKELVEGGQYDNLLALADLLYFKGVSTASEREQLLDASGANAVVKNSDFNGIEEYYMTDDEIDAVQQAAIWYFTNYEENGRYDKYGQTSWIWYTSSTDNGQYKNFSSYNPTGMPYAGATAGYFRQQQMVKLYSYLIDTAKSNASQGINDEKTILTVYASNQDAEAQPIMEVIKIPKEFDLSLRKYITAVNDETVKNSRVPDIDESTLENGTTATYKHRKDPVEVAVNDTITYNITIYNEGEKAGRATKIEDQLPTGLKYVEVVSGNFELDSYSETDNLLKLKRTSNTDNLSAYDGGATLDSETIQIKCEVTANAGSEDSILTNVAWISEAYDAEDNKTITTEKKADTDSEPGTKPTVDKDSLVTEDDGYVGNSNNSEKDLTNSQEYFEGEQDDDDFEKIVVEARTQITVTKQWEDNNNQDGKRPTSVEVELYKNGSATGETKTLTGSTWTATFTNLPVYEGGEEITYTVKEVNVPEGYTESGEGTEENDYTIINTHTPGLTSVSVNKVWNDNNDQDGVRPDEIQVELLKNGEETGNIITLNEGNNWAGTFNNLPVNEEGEKITYTVKEITISGYAVNITQNSENNFTITNTHTPGVTSVNVNKVWDDNNDQDGLRPYSIEVELLKNGEPTGNIITLNEENHWTGTFNNLPIKENGVDIDYTVREITQIEGYTTEITENTETVNNANDTQSVANTKEPEITTQTYAAKDMVRATVATVEPKSFRITNTHLVEEAFDLALRKFIVAVSEDETIEESDILMNEDGTGYAREPVVDASKLNTSAEDGSTITTAIYNHTKEPVLVEKNDIVVYMLRVYNEGEQDGYAAEIKDDLPPYLTFVDSEFNEQYGWEVSEDGRTVTTRYLENSLIAKPETDESGNHILSYVQVPIMCKVSGNANANENITNIADITEYQDKDKQPVEDRDSEQDNVEVPSDGNLPGYKEEESENDYVPGQEDDDDFEKVYVQDFDLALRKFISEVDGTTYNRVPNVDLSGLESGTTAIYNHTKDPVLVKRNSVIIYTIRVYNEGDISGYAEEVTDYLPEGLEFLPEHEINLQYEWQVSEDGRYVTTDYLSSAKETIERQNEIQAFDGQTIDYKEVQIACQVKDNVESNVKLTNLAEITEDSDEDRDSTPDNVEIPGDEELPGYKDDEIDQDYVPGQEDDDDFEKIYVEEDKEFDLALRKFISEVDGTQYNREPNVDLSGLESGTTAIYNHTKDPVLVKRNSVIIYTIRVYNEGDISGYAEEVTDYLPEGLEFLPEHEINLQYEWQVSEDGRYVTTDYLSSAKETIERQNEIQAFDGQTIDYKEVQIACQVKDNVESNVKLTNLAEITEDSDEDRDSTPDNVEIPGDEELPGYKDDEIDQEYVPGQEDDDDFEKVIIQDFDLALRKFITKVDEEEVTTRVPEVSYDREEDKIRYNHTKEPVEVITGNVVEYTIRVYNEGDIAGYAEEIADDIPDGLRYLPENETNTEYRWVMYDEEGNVTENSEEAVEIRTDYLSKEQEETEGENLLQAFNPEEEIGEGNPDYRDIKVAFEVVEPNESDRIIVNSAQITEDSDENGNPVEDIDSIPDEWNEGEDDQDREYIKLTYFDLALRKWVTEAIVIENGQETITQTGHTAEMAPEPVVKVELYRKDLNDVVVKFRYKIRITNEGNIAGYATEITDYVPEGLRFVAEDNPGWTDEGNNVISTRLLENTLLQPGESAEVEVVLTWINGEDNMGQMTNIAEISEDYNDKGAPDRDSTPDNQVWGEDDIDDAPVLLSIETGQERIYYVLGFTVLGTLAGGLVLIKKFVI